MNLIAGVSRVWSELGWADLVLWIAVPLLVLLTAWWTVRELERREREEIRARREAEAAQRKRLDSFVSLSDWTGPRKAGEHNHAWHSKDGEA